MNTRCNRPSPDSGFTLVEMMICVAIIGMLASIAIPMFSSQQLRTKTTEAKTNLGAIRVVEEANYGEAGSYLGASAEPTVIPGLTAVDFDSAGSDFAELGWSPEGRVYFSYAVVIPADGSGYTADAAADIDGDGVVQIWGNKKAAGDGSFLDGGLGCDQSLIEPETVSYCVTTGSVY